MSTPHSTVLLLELSELSEEPSVVPILDPMGEAGNHDEQNEGEGDKGGGCFHASILPQTMSRRQARAATLLDRTGRRTD